MKRDEALSALIRVAAELVVARDVPNPEEQRFYFGKQATRQLLTRMNEQGRTIRDAVDAIRRDA